MNKKIIIAIIAVLVLAALVAVVRFTFKSGFSSKPIVLTGTYDIQQDYCGKAIDSHYCQCAFQGENCETIGIFNQDDARRLVTAGYDKWVIEKQKEECAEKGGRWKKDVCRK